MSNILVEAGWSEEGARFIEEHSRDRRINGALRRFGFKAVRTHKPSNKAKIPASLRWQVWERDNFTCRHCGARKHLAVDHIKPEVSGGTLDLANVQTLCKSCNSKKGAR